MKRWRHLHSQSGFTFPEVLVTVIIVAIGTLSVMGVFISVNKLNSQSKHLAAATQAAQKKVESYRNAGFSSLPAAGTTVDFTSDLPSTLGSSRQALAKFTDKSSASAPNSLRQVTIEITYSDGKASKRVDLTTYIAKRGINR